MKQGDIMNLIPDRKYAIVMLVLSIIYCAAALLLDADFNPVNEKFYPFVLSVLMIISSIGLVHLALATHDCHGPKGKMYKRSASPFVRFWCTALSCARLDSSFPPACLWEFACGYSKPSGNGSYRFRLSLPSVFILFLTDCWD